MISSHRRNKIKQIILTHGSANTTDLMDLFNVSGETIRRDLLKIEKEGYVKKKYGGAVASTELYKLINGIPPVQQRKFVNTGDKSRIAMMASNMIEDDMCVYIDAGTTTCSLIQFISCGNLNIVTNSVDIAAECALKENWNIVLAGGQLIKQSMCLIGAEAECYVNSINFDVAFIGCSGVSCLRGFTCSNEQEAKLKKTAISKAFRSVVMADGTKYNRANMYTFAALDEINCYITTSGGVDDDFIKKADDAGMDIIIA